MSWRWILPYYRRRQERYRAVFAPRMLVPRCDRCGHEIQIEADGEWVLADLAEALGFGQNPYSKGDPHATTFNVGRAYALLHIRTVLDMSQAQMAQIVKAHEEGEQRAEGGPLA